MKPASLLRTLLLALLLAAAAGATHFALFTYRPVLPAAARSVTILPGSSLAQVASRLEESGVVANAIYFRILGRLRGVAEKIKAGEYDFEEAATPGLVLDRLVTGDVRRYRFTVPEGLTLMEIAAKLRLEGLGDEQRFARLCTDPRFIADLDLHVSSLEGYLFPETYSLARGDKEEKLIRAMVGQFRQVFTEALASQAETLGFSTHELVTLASIIQKESGRAEEMPLISAVFHNRLQRGMRLQADPTVIYGIENFDGNLTRRHLAEKTPYNTYRVSGLPPGPIANPGRDALMAALHPADQDYLYFVARGDGSHVFTRNLEDHNRAVRKYQLRR